MNYVTEVSPTFDDQSKKLDFETTKKIKNNKNVKRFVSFKNLGGFIENINGKSLNFSSSKVVHFLYSLIHLS